MSHSHFSFRRCRHGRPRRTQRRALSLLVGLHRRGMPHQPAEIEEVLLGGGALLRARRGPLVDERARRHRWTVCSSHSPLDRSGSRADIGVGCFRTYCRPFPTPRKPSSTCGCTHVQGESSQGLADAVGVATGRTFQVGPSSTGHPTRRHRPKKCSWRRRAPSRSPPPKCRRTRAGSSWMIRSDCLPLDGSGQRAGAKVGSVRRSKHSVTPPRHGDVAPRDTENPARVPT